MVTYPFHGIYLSTLEVIFFFFHFMILALDNDQISTNMAYLHFACIFLMQLCLHLHLETFFILCFKWDNCLHVGPLNNSWLHENGSQHPMCSIGPGIEYGLHQQWLHLWMVCTNFFSHLLLYLMIILVSFLTYSSLTIYNDLIFFLKCPQTMQD